MARHNIICTRIASELQEMYVSSDALQTSENTHGEHPGDKAIGGGV